MTLSLPIKNAALTKTLWHVALMLNFLIETLILSVIMVNVALLDVVVPFLALLVTCF
jgi:hypothetical protein